MFAKFVFNQMASGMIVLSAAIFSGSPCVAADVVLTDNRVFPGELWESRPDAGGRMIHRREATANPAFPQAAMKIAHVTVGPEGKLYFVSGLDGYVLHLLDGRHEVLSFEFPGQIRDIDSGNEEHTVYFSVVPTPQNGEPLADGKIYRRDLWAGQPSEAATVRQSEIGGGWWGTFTRQNGSLYIATFESPSRIFKLTSDQPEPVFTTNRYKIHGLAATEDGTFLFTDGTDTVYRTRDFVTVEPVVQADRNFTDVSVKPVSPGTGG
jgi:hypothetical protein